MMLKTLSIVSAATMVAGDANTIMDGLNAIEGPSSMRNLGNTVIGQMLNNYGCWCMFQSSQQNFAKGAPQDDFDKLCQKYHAGAQCAIIDVQDCRPFSQSYNPVYNQGFLHTDAELRAACDAANPGDACGIRVCEIETKFIESVFSHLQVGSIPNTLQYSQSQGFQRADHCLGFVGTQSDKQCCGTSPARFPYDAAIKSCCAESGIGFFSGIEQCCADGSIVSAGDSC